MTFQELDLTKKYTYADYQKWTFQERLELIKGKIYAMSPAPNRKHQEVSVRVTTDLYNFLENRPCKVYSAPFDVRLTPRKNDKHGKVHTVVQPDICVVCDLDKLDDLGCVGAPDLIIEILSPGNTRKEMQNKFEIYQENGVAEYWIIHPTDEYILQYVTENGKYKVGKYYYEEEIVESSSVKDFKVMVSDVLTNH